MSLHELAEDARARAGAAHLSWGVAIGGEIVEHGGSALDRPFRIASMTKSFTAATVMALRDRGDVVLDEPVATYVPEWTVSPPTTDAPGITVRHLLTMRAGLPQDDPWADRLLSMDDDAFTALLGSGATFAMTPGAGFEYSNLGYAVLGRLIANVTARRVHDVISETIIEPLGLTSTHWDRDSRGAFDPMGGLWSTVSDLLRWSHWWCSAFPPRDGHDAGPLRRSTRREMQPTGGVGYAFGLHLVTHRGVGPVVTHSGGLPGWGSDMRWLPRRQLAFVSLADATYAPMWDLNVAFVDEMVQSDALPAEHVADATLMRLAADRLAAWLSGDGDDPFSANVALDASFDFDALRSQLGSPVAVASVRPELATWGSVELGGPSGTVTVEVELNAEPQPRIQRVRGAGTPR
jgi:CubicO group peptidase (beta-lactamase class C family)